MKSAIRIRAAAANGDQGEEVKTNGHAATKKRKGTAKNGDAKRKKATDFF
jgi:hypothetical protein